MDEKLSTFSRLSDKFCGQNGKRLPQNAVPRLTAQTQTRAKFTPMMIPKINTQLYVLLLLVAEAGHKWTKTMSNKSMGPVIQN